MIPRVIATLLSKYQRDILMDHIDSRLPIVTTDGTRMITIHHLVNRKLLRFVNPMTNRPRYSEITNLGREVICIVLGDYADALVRTGFLAEKLNVKLPPPIATELDAESRLRKEWE